MTRIVRARYANGALTPMEPLDLAENAEVRLTIEELPVKSKKRHPKRPFKVKPLPGGFMPGINVDKIRDVLSEMDDEEFRRKAEL